MVGAGSAGSVVANRLSENDDWKILLLEAGGNPTAESEIPYLFSTVLKTNHTWNYDMEKSDKSSKALEHSWMMGGKMLGGSSGANTLLYMRGNKQDYDQWDEMGNVGWGFDNVLKYFKKSEGNKLDQFIEMFHNHDGPLSIDAFNNTDQVTQILFDAAAELGYQELKDINADEALGFGLAQGTLQNGERCSSAKAFLSSIKDRQNLHIIKNALVTTLIIENGKQVKGVNFLLNGQEMKAMAKNEVTLSAGTILSPRILMASGIGPAKDLEKLGITVVHNLPVGENLQDHVLVPYMLKVDPGSSQVMNNIDTVESIYAYLKYRVGKFAGIGITDFQGFVNTLDDSVYPDVQYMFSGFTKQTIDFKRLCSIYGCYEEYLEQLNQFNQEAYLLLVQVTLLHPKSRGKIELRSTDPHDLPIIRPNYLDVQEDVETIIKGIQGFKKFLATNTFKRHQIEEAHMKIEECDKLKYDSHEYWECFVRYFSKSIYQLVGTCKMGPDTDLEAVVDPRLRVKGINGLRVVDASIIPTITSGKMNSVAIMIGEKAADMIKEDWDAI